MADETSTQEDEKSTPEGEGETSAPEEEKSAKESETSTQLKAGDAARAIGFAVSPAAGPKPEAEEAPIPAARPAAAARPALSAAARDKMRPGAFTAVFDKAREKLAAAHGALKDTIASKAFVLQDARPTLADPGSERDRWVLKDGRALDGIVYLAVPVGKLEWHASFGRECLNYATLARNTNKRHAIMPQYGDTVIAYVNNMLDNQAPALVEVDPADLGDVEAWVQARVAEMLDVIDRRRAAIAKKA